MSNISFEHAINLSNEVTRQESENQKEKLTEFLESTCDLFSYADWQYYADETGKSINWLMQNASYYDDNEAHGTMLNNALIDNDTELMELFI